MMAVFQKHWTQFVVKLRWLEVIKAYFTFEENLIFRPEKKKENPFASNSEGLRDWPVPFAILGTLHFFYLFPQHWLLSLHKMTLWAVWTWLSWELQITSPSTSQRGLFECDERYSLAQIFQHPVAPKCEQSIVLLMTIIGFLEIIQVPTEHLIKISPYTEMCTEMEGVISQLFPFMLLFHSVTGVLVVIRTQTGRTEAICSVVSSISSSHSLVIRSSECSSSAVTRHTVIHFGVSHSIGTKVLAQGPKVPTVGTILQFIYYCPSCLINSI